MTQGYKGKIAAQPIVFDHTVYFLSFDAEKMAWENFALLTSSSAR